MLSALRPHGPQMKEGSHHLQIDGSYKEGGGQILRNAITYAVLLQKHVTITKIRSNRPRNRGVRPQHLSGMNLAVDICGGKLKGAEVGSTEVSYIPTKECIDDSPKRAKILEHYVADTGTAGSVALLLQTSFLPALVASNYLGQTILLELRGGTNAENAPQIDYITSILLPFINGYYSCNMSEFKALDIDVVKRGYYPKGGGIVHASVSLPCPSSKQSTFPPINLTHCRPISSLRITAFYAGKCPAWIPQKMVDGALKALKQACKENDAFANRFCGQDVDAKVNAHEVLTNAEIVTTHDTNCLGSASGIMIVAYPDVHPNDRTHHVPLGASTLGNRNVPPLQSGVNVANELIDCIASGGCVDRWMQDQLIPFMALANSNTPGGTQRSEMMVGELTLHTQTAIAVAEQVTNCKFEVLKLHNDAYVECRLKVVGQNDYGEAGLIRGKHIIRCEGIGYNFSRDNVL